MSMKMFNNDMIVKLFDDNMEDFDRFRQKLERSVRTNTSV